jgi:Tol biopolymer transport system component
VNAVKRPIAGVTVAGMILFGLVATGGLARAVVPGSNGQLAFARQVPTGGANVFTANPDGSGEQQVPLVYSAEDFGVPVWSPDGTKLLISHTLRLDSSGNCCLPFRPAIVNPDGSGFTLLTISYGPFDMGCQVWSLDQTRLLCGFGGDQPGVFSVRASDGGDPVRLSTNPFGTADVGAMDVPTDISPDGTRFVFVRFRPGAKDAAQKVALFVENVDGSGLRQITPYGFAQAHEIASARWSPDGQEIISETREGLLFMVHPDGSGTRLIRLQTGTNPYYAFEPDWSPDGTRIVFCMSINGQEDVYTAKADGSDLIQVTDTPDFENGPDWGTHPLAT